MPVSLYYGNLKLSSPKDHTNERSTYCKGGGSKELIK